MVHQHFGVVNTFTVLENIILGVEQGFTLAPSLSAAKKKLKELAAQYGLDVPLDARLKICQ